MIKAIFFDFYGVVNVEGKINREVAEFLQGNNGRYLFVILSAANIDLHDWLITHGVNDYFAVVQTTYKAGKSKSDPKFYNNVIEKLDLRPEEVIMIDDSPSYIELVQNLGMWGLLYIPNQNFLSQLKPLLNS